jgi:hypothetical protein
MPFEGAPGWASKANKATSSTQTPKAPSTPYSPPPAIAPQSRPGGIEETTPAAAMPDVTEPAEVDGSSKPKKKKKRSSSSSEIPVAVARPPVSKSAPVPEPAPAPVAVPSPTQVSESDDDDDDTVTDFGMVMALSCVALAGVAFFATLFPFGRYISAVLAGVGFLGGLASLGAEGRAKAVGGLAAGLHFLILLFVLVLPSWIGLDSWGGIEIENTPPAPQAFVHGKKTSTLAQWVDASTASWQFKDVRVTIASAGVGPIELIDAKGVKRPSKEHYLQLIVKVTNIGVERPLDLSGWTIGQNLELVNFIDSTGKALTPATFEEGWRPDSQPSKTPEKLFPGHVSEIRLIYSPPQPKIDFLRLTLPATMFGFEEEAIKFQIESNSLVLPGPRKK